MPSPNDPSTALGIAMLSCAPLSMVSFALMGLGSLLGSKPDRFWDEAAWQDGKYVRVRFGIWRPIQVGILTAAGLALLLSLGFGFGVFFMLPPALRQQLGSCGSLLLLGLWGTPFAGGVLAYAYRRAVPARSGSDLRIDDSAKVIMLPTTKRRKLPVVVPVAGIVSIKVKKERRSVSDADGSNSEKTVLIATVLFRNRDGMEQSEGIVEFSNQDRARSFADWLRKRLGVTQQTQDESSASAEA
jgi:hypothetical protein